MKRIRKSLFFCIAALVLVAMGVFAPGATVFADTLSAEQNYIAKSEQIKTLEAYSRENKSQIVLLLQDYADAKQNYLTYCSENSQTPTLDHDAETKYFIVNYGYASDEILGIKYFSDNQILAEQVMFAYNKAWTELKENNLAMHENLDANAKYYSLFAQKENMKKVVAEPEPLDEKYVYDGQLKTFKFDAMFDANIMSVSGLQQRDAGIYKVVVSLKDRSRYEWAHAGHSGTLEFVWIIEKASLEDKISDFEDKTFVQDGQNKSLVANVTSSSIKVAYSDNNLQSEPGIYKIKATFFDLSDNYETAVRYATMTIKPSSFVQKDDSTDIEQVIVEQAGGFDPMLSLEVTTLANDRLKFGDVNYSKHISSGEEVAIAYEIDLKRDGLSVEPDGELLLKMYIPESVQGKRFRLLHTHYSPAQTVKEIDYVLSGNYAVVSTSELSQFAFVVEKEQAKTLSTWEFAGIVVAIVLGVLILIYLIMFFIWKFLGKCLSLFEGSFRRFSRFVTGTQYNKKELAEQEKQVANIS